VFLLILPSRLRALHITAAKLQSYRLAIWKMVRHFGFLLKSATDNGYQVLLSLLFISNLLFLAFRARTAALHTKASVAADAIQTVATFGAIYVSFVEDQRSVQPSDLSFTCPHQPFYLWPDSVHYGLFRMCQYVEGYTLLSLFLRLLRC
jgi:hypothetical protein